MSNNPYESPISGNPQFEDGSGSGAEPRGWAKHIRIVAGLMIAQGALLFVVGAVSLFFFTRMFNDEKFLEQLRIQQERQGNQAAPITPETMQRWMVRSYRAIGGLTMAVALFNVVAGWRNFFYRGRVMGVFALVSSLAAMFTCYCFPTAVILLVYGLLVYLSADGQAAFASRSAATA
ncbi:MAG TPA: hypothetical protein VHZ24_02030 [Pirellulales bacterium]|jgi:hypothetical protein|nr:hypothetical protein [Pirellulales bacterium]